MLELHQSPSTDCELRARPSSKMLRDYHGANLLKAFPLQFPHGHGAFSELKNKSMSFATYTDHIHHLSLPNMHKPDFILILHNMFERDRVLRSAVWHSNQRFKVGDPAVGELFSTMSSKLLTKAVDQAHNGIPTGHGVGARFLRTISACCKSMCHTNEAAKEARQRMFSMVHRFGLPAVFFTVTPDDNNIFRLKVHANPNERNPCTDLTMDEEQCLMEFKFRSKLRTDYSGLSAFDFESMMDIVVKHIIGWDDEEHGATEDGGVFGRPIAYSMAVEEQGPKTLHAQFFNLDRWVERFVAKSLL